MDGCIEGYECVSGNNGSRPGHGSGVLQSALTKQRLIGWGFYDLSTACHSLLLELNSQIHQKNSKTIQIEIEMVVIQW